MRIGLIGLACLLMVGCEQERVIDLDQLQDRNGVYYEVDSSEPFTGRVVGTHENGQKVLEATFVDGKQEDVQTQWYENGQRSLEGNFVNGVSEGVFSEWYENGQKEYEATYVNGEREGVVTEWYENGQKGLEATYVNGKQEGVETWWHENGEVRRVTCWKNNDEVSMDNCQ